MCRRISWICTLNQKVVTQIFIVMYNQNKFIRGRPFHRFYEGMLKTYFSFINPDNVKGTNQITQNNNNVCVASRFDRFMHVRDINLVIYTIMAGQ